jgi:hypothetical protein
MGKSGLTPDHLFNFMLYGISSYAKEYKLAWYINTELGIDMVKQEDIEMQFVNGRVLSVSNFLFETENRSFKLLRNKSVSEQGGKVEFLLPELKKFDYLILVQGFEDTYSDDDLKKLLAPLKPIQFVQKFDPLSLKSKENLIF